MSLKGWWGDKVIICLISDGIRRHKKWCEYYEKDNRCSFKCIKCSGSAFCNEYKKRDEAGPITLYSSTEIPPEVKRVEIKDEPSMPPIKQPAIDNLFPGRYPKYDENLVGYVVLAKTGFNKIVLGLVIDANRDYITIDKDDAGITKYDRRISFLRNSIWVLEEYSNLSQNKKDDPLGFRWLTK